MNLGRTGSDAGGGEQKMTVTFEHRAGTNVLETGFRGELTRDDYETFVAQIGRMVKSHRVALRVLVALQNFGGWEESAFLDDRSIDVRALDAVERVALVGDSRWERGAAGFGKAFRRAETRYFSLSQQEKARAWLEEE